MTVLSLCRVNDEVCPFLSTAKASTGQESPAFSRSMKSARIPEEDLAATFTSGFKTGIAGDELPLRAASALCFHELVVLLRLEADGELLTANEARRSTATA